MSRTASIHLTLWDGEYDFRLRIGELTRVQEACDAGPMHILRRLQDGTWKIEDVRETLRLGLIGAGTKQDDALDLIRRHVDPPFLADNVLNAALVLQASIIGVEDEPLGEAVAAQQNDLPNEESSASPPSTGSVPS